MEMKKFNELYAKIIFEETEQFNKTKVKSLIKSILVGNYQNVKLIKNGYSCEILTMKPMSKKHSDDDIEYSHDSRVSTYHITFELMENDEIKLMVVRVPDILKKGIKEKTFKIKTNIKELNEEISKFIDNSISNLH